MDLLITNKKAFEDFLTVKKVTTENAESYSKTAFISIVDPGVKSFFSADKKNVKVLTFSITPNGIDVTLTENAFTEQQAKELYEFIKANKDANVMNIHCTSDISRSAAVASFINEFLDGHHRDLEEAFPNGVANKHVLRLLEKVWGEEKKKHQQQENDGILGVYENAELNEWDRTDIHMYPSRQ